MIKLAPTPLKSLESYSSYTRCAEIHYQSTDYQIVCVECHEIYQHLNEFVQHFQDEHFYEFLENLHNIYSTNNVLITKQDKCVKQEISEILEDDQPHQLSVRDNENNVKQTPVYEQVKTCETVDCKEQGRLDSAKKKRPAFQCQYCSKEFTHRAALVSHETRHTQKRHIPCEDCTKLFYTQNQLDTHRRKLHRKMQDVNEDNDISLPYACDMCTKRYRSASMLSTHKFKKHYKTAKFSCERCDKKFVEQNQLNVHMSIHLKKE